MLIRKALDKDAKEIISLLKEVLEIHASIRPDLFKSGSCKYKEEDILNKLKDKNTPIYVAEEDDKFLGYLLCEIIEINEANRNKMKVMYIDDIAVKKEFRGKHIGEALFYFVKEEAKRLNCYEITLRIYEGNESAMSFYKKMGMKTQSSYLEYILK
jgi:ribosomal protein S18 acetylase RimI-like enzyme